MCIRDRAEALRGRILYLHRDDVKLEPGRHFIQDLLGLRIVDADTGELDVYKRQE